MGRVCFGKMDGWMLRIIDEVGLGWVEEEGVLFWGDEMGWMYYQKLADLKNCTVTTNCQETAVVGANLAGRILSTYERLGTSVYLHHPSYI